MTSRFLAMLAMPALLLASGCIFIPSSSNGAGNSGVPQAKTDADAKQVADLGRSLEANRTQALDASASDLDGYGDRLYWQTHGSFSPALHSRSNEQTVDYQFGIGAGDGANVRISSALIVTASRDNDGVVYRAYDPASPNVLLGSATFAAPGDEQKWWAYAADGTNAYVVTADAVRAGAAHTVWRFAPPGQPAALFTLEEAGLTPGEILDLGVEGNTMVLVESGRLWAIDLATKHATSLHDQTEVTGTVWIEDDGIAWEEARGLFFFSHATGETRDVSEELIGAAYRLNASYPDSHRFYAASTQRNFTRFGDWLVYTANFGIFAYNVTSRAIVPVLLETPQADGARVSYRYPLALTNGHLFVVGLMSTSGSVGADGPVFEIDLNVALR
jgi:hypothetical protein